MVNDSQIKILLLIADCCCYPWTQLDYIHSHSTTILGKHGERGQHYWSSVTLSVVVLSHHYNLGIVLR